MTHSGLMERAGQAALQWDFVSKAGEALARGDEFYREILDVLPAALYLTDAAGRITYYNEAAAALWGWRPELGTAEWCGSWKLFWPDGRAMAHGDCPMAIAVKEKRPILGMEAVAERPDGSRVPFIPYPTPLFDRSGTLIGAVNLLVDITDRKRAEQVTMQLASIVEFLGRRNRQQGSERDHHQLESRSRAVVRLHRRRGDRPTGDHAHSGGSHRRGA